MRHNVDIKIRKYLKEVNIKHEHIRNFDGKSSASDRIAVEMTAAQRIIEILLLNILDHSEHHINPLIPLYRLHESQNA